MASLCCVAASPAATARAWTQCSNLPAVHVLDVAWQEARIRLSAGLRLVVETGSARPAAPPVG